MYFSLKVLEVAGNLASQGLTYIQEIAEIGISADQIDKKIHDFIISKDCYPTPQKFMGFPKSICISPNDILCHGIPNSRKFQSGDFVNFDLTLYKNGVHGDNSIMIKFGKVDPKIDKLIKVNQEAVYESILQIKEGMSYNKIVLFINRNIADKNGFYSNEIFTGHGIGKHLHLPPTVYGIKNNVDFPILRGHAFTIEPIFTLNQPNGYYMWDDNFTVVSPGNPSSQWEHTILIDLDGKIKVITKREEEEIILRNF